MGGKVVPPDRPRRRPPTLAVAALASGLLLPAAAAAQDTRVVELRLADGVVTGAEVESAGRRPVLRVRQGDTVELRWTTDQATELHLHGYDVEVHTTAGGAAVMTFAARAAGRFPIEAHDLGDKTVLYVEVLPR